MEWISKHIESSGFDRDITFEELQQKNTGRNNLKELYVVAVNVDRGLTEVFSYLHTPLVPIRDAVRVSISIPLFFEAYKIREKRGNEFIIQEALYTDGGWYDNYPIWVFDNKYFIRDAVYSVFDKDAVKRNKKTLGFKLVTTEDKRLFEEGKMSKKNKIESESGSEKSILDSPFAKQVTRFWEGGFDKHKSDHYNNGDRVRTVYIDILNVSMLAFNLDRKTKGLLIASGEEGARNYRKRILQSPYLNRKSTPSSHAIASQSPNAVNIPYHSPMRPVADKELKATSSKEFSLQQDDDLEQRFLGFPQRNIKKTTGIFTQSATLNQDTGEISCLLLYPGNRLISACNAETNTSSKNNVIIVWDLKTATWTQKLVKNFDYGSAHHLSLLPHPNSKYLITGFSDGTISIWDLETGLCQQTFTLNYRGCLLIHRDRKLIGVSLGKMINHTYETVIKVWDLKTGNPS